MPSTSTRGARSRERRQKEIGTRKEAGSMEQRVRRQKSEVRSHRQASEGGDRKSTQRPPKTKSQKTTHKREFGIIENRKSKM
jgi:hypothetical protein